MPNTLPSKPALVPSSTPATKPTKKSNSSTPSAPTNNNIQDIFARLLALSIGPSMASRGVPPGTPILGGLMSPMSKPFNPMRIG